MGNRRRHKTRATCLVEIEDTTVVVFLQKLVVTLVGLVDNSLQRVSARVETMYLGVGLKPGLLFVFRHVANALDFKPA